MPGNHVDSDLTSTNTASTWRKAARCASEGCVEVRRTAAGVEVRDSKQPDGPVLTYSAADWQTHVVDEIRDGGWLPEFTYREDDADETVVVRRSADGPELRFTGDEWDTFVDGVRRGEFDLERLRRGGGDPVTAASSTYRKKPVHVQAMQWTGDNEPELCLFADGNFEAVDPDDRDNLDDPEATGSLLTTRHSHWALMYTGDWVLKATDGELECWRDDDFAEVFEAVTE